MNQILSYVVPDMAPVGDRGLGSSPGSTDESIGELRYNGQVDSDGCPCGTGELLSSQVTVRGTFLGGASHVDECTVIANDFNLSGSLRGFKPFGECTLVHSNGSCIHCHFEDGLPSGQVTWENGDGVTFNGRMDKGRANGHGCLRAPSYTYTGEWVDGNKQGRGTETVGEEEYDGEFRGNSRHGEGELRMQSNGERLYAQYRKGRLIRRCSVAEHENETLREEQRRLEGRVVEAEREASQATEARIKAEAELSELSNSLSSRACSVCYERPATRASLPCGHLCMCPECCTRIQFTVQKCPICRQPCKTAVDIFVS